MKQFKAHGVPPEDSLKKRLKAKVSPRPRKKPHEMSDDELDLAVYDTELLVPERSEILDEIKLRIMKKGVEVGVEMERGRVEREAEDAEKTENVEEMQRRQEDEGRLRSINAKIEEIFG